MIEWWQAVIMYMVWRVAADVIQSMPLPSKDKGVYAFAWKLLHHLIGDSKSIIRILLARRVVGEVSGIVEEHLKNLPPSEHL